MPQVEFYLVKCAAHWYICPLGTTEVNKLLAKLLLRILRQTIVHAGQLLAEEAQLSTVTSECASSFLMLWCEGLGVARGGHQYDAGGPGYGSEVMTHVDDACAAARPWMLCWSR